jgi:hypothetical protein
MDLHAHIYSAARDCDGLYTRDYIMEPNDDERTGEGGWNWFGDLDFKSRVLNHVVSMYGLGGTLTVTTLDDGMAHLEWSEATDEGYRIVEATFCEDNCDLGESHYRDHTAEAAGY